VHYTEYTFEIANLHKNLLKSGKGLSATDQKVVVLIREMIRPTGREEE
jgi:hypothetical protein